MFDRSYSELAKPIATLIGSCYFIFFSLHVASAPYFSYLGGDLSDYAYAITTDSQNNIYITGSTNSGKFDGFEVPQNKTHDDKNCFVTRINRSNPDLNYYVEFAGSSRETCRAITVDSAFNVYVTGETQSNDLPVTTNKPFAGVWDAFVFKLNALGELVYASYIGGKLTDYGHGITIRNIDDVFITGETWSQDFPTTSNAYAHQCNCDGVKANAFVTQVDTSVPTEYLSAYSTYIGGSNQDKSHSIRIDPYGILHLAGETQSTDFPLANEISNHLKGSIDGFITLMDPTKNGDQSLLFSSYIGGNGDDTITEITTNAVGDSFVTGSTSSDDFPTTIDAFSRRCANGQVDCLSTITNDQHSDSFITKISNNEISYSTLFGGSKDETGHGIIVDSENAIYVSGSTNSLDFPLTDNAIDKTCNNSNPCHEDSDSFLIKINPTLSNKSGLVFSSYLGGNKTDNATGLHIEESHHIALTGETISPDLSTSQALDAKQQNSEAYLQIVEITGNGTWIDNTPEPEPQTTAMASSLGVFHLIIFSVFGGVLRLSFS